MANPNPRPNTGAHARTIDAGARTRTSDPGGRTRTTDPNPRTRATDPDARARTTDPDARARTTDELRDEIDHGRGGDKKGFPDPAAAPLGTDAEAAGTPPTPRERDMAYRAEIANRPDGPTASEAQRPVATDHADHTDHADLGSAADRTDPDAAAPDAAGPSVLIFIGIIAAVVAVILAAWLL